MELKNKSILIISPEPWDHIFVSKHHYAIYLAKRGNKVFFLNPPANDMGMTGTRFMNVFEVDYPGFPKGLRFYPAFLQRRLMARMYKRIEELCAIQFDIIWSFDNSVFFDFTCLPSRTIRISHIVDLSQNFQTRKAASTADYCFCTTERIKNVLARFNRKVYKINHGFSISPGTESRVPELSARTKAIYAGNLSIPYIDWELLSELIEANREVDFVLIGPGANEFDGESLMYSAKKRVLESTNVFLTGPVDSSELQQYYRLADVLLVAYREKYQNDQVANPHKMMEYLASGKVIVSTFTKEFEFQRDLLAMAENNMQFLNIFEDVVNNLPVYNSQNRREDRIAFAKNNTYEKQINRIEEIIYIHNCHI